VGSGCRCSTSSLHEEQIADGDRLVAVRAGATGTDPTAEDAAIRAALLAEVADLAGRALVDGGRSWRAGWDRDDRRDRLAGSPGGLTAAI
jgi:hypothetical protein